MKDGENENLSSFWIDRDDVNRCDDNLMVTKSLAIKAGKILNSSCREKFEGYKCWREYKGLLLNLKAIHYNRDIGHSDMLVDFIMVLVLRC